MDFSKMTEAEFEAKLDELTPKELYKMAEGYNLKLPSGMRPQLIIKAMYAALTAPKISEPASTEDAKSGAPSSPDAPVDAGPTFSALSLNALGHWRCNHKWTNRWQHFPLSKFSPMELKTLKADKNLKTRGIPDEV